MRRQGRQPDPGPEARVGMTLFAFDAGEAISTHAAPGDAMATILEGAAEITIDGTPHTPKRRGGYHHARGDPPRSQGADPVQDVPGRREGVTRRHDSVSVSDGGDRMPEKRRSMRPARTTWRRF